jgi:transcriptional regulator with XRE-family HTH domain
MELGECLRATRVGNGTSARDVALLAGVAPSTVIRVEGGQLPNVSWELALRLLAANDLGPDMKPVSAPTGIAAARRMLGDAVAEQPDFAGWLRRWRLLRLVDDAGQVRDVRSLAFRAGRSALLANRSGSVSVARRLSWLQVGDRLSSGGVEWANTGDSAANRVSLFADQVWPVFYVEDVVRAVEAIGSPVMLPGQRGPRTLLVPFDGFSEVGRWQDENGPTEGVWYAAPWQVAMDCYAGVQRMLLQAEHLIDLWEGEVV